MAQLAIGPNKSQFPAPKTPGPHTTPTPVEKKKTGNKMNREMLQKTILGYARWAKNEQTTSKRKLIHLAHSISYQDERDS